MLTLRERHAVPTRAIGRTLRMWRTERGLSLRQVERASSGQREPITFDWLSRMENGQFTPSVPKLITLATIYGRPVTDLLDMFETEQLRSLIPRRGDYEFCRQLGIESLEKGQVTKALGCFLGALEGRSGSKPQLA